MNDVSEYHPAEDESKWRLGAYRSFCKDFVEMQYELPTVPKDKSGQEGNQRYKYADLSSIMEAAKEPMHKYGFSIMQMARTQIIDGDLYAGVITHLIHRDGHMESITTLLPVKSERGTLVKAIGGVMTYARRYALAILGICTEEDLEDAPGVGGKSTPKLSKSKASPPKKVSEEKMDVHRAAAETFNVFLSDVKNVSELEEFWKSNSTALKEMESEDPDRYKKVLDNFKARKMHIASL